jgi:flagellar basal body-associated protein FliL
MVQQSVGPVEGKLQEEQADHQLQRDQNGKRGNVIVVVVVVVVVVVIVVVVVVVVVNGTSMWTPTWMKAQRARNTRQQMTRIKMPAREVV